MGTSLYLIGRAEIERRDVTLIGNALMESINAYRAGERPLQAVHFGTNAFDDDPRALFDIPEVRAWCRELYAAIPLVFSLLHAETIRWVFPCVADIDIKTRTASSTAYEYKPERKKKLVDEIMAAQKGLFNTLASTQEEFDRLVDDSLERLRLALT